MDTTARVPDFSSTHSKESRVGGHVHQLLNLADALIHAVSVPPTNPFTADTAAGPADPGPDLDHASASPFGIDLGVLTDRECVQWAQDLERLATIQHAMAVHAAAELAFRTESGRFETLGIRSPVDMLVQSLRIGATDAHRRITLSQAVLPTINTLTGETTPARQPMLGQAFFTGTIPQEQAVQVAKYVEEASRLAQNGRISTDCRNDVETTLVTTAQEEAPGYLRQVGNRIMALLDPDGQKPSHADLTAKQGIHFRKPRRGLVGIDGYLTIEQYEHLMTSIARFTNPNLRTTTKSDNASGEGTTTEGTTTGDGADESAGTDWAGLWADSGPLTPETQHPTASTATGGSDTTVGSDGTGGSAGFSRYKRIQGVEVPAPGSMDELQGLDPLDPDNHDPVIKDDRTYAQKLLDGLLECVKIAARTDTLPLSGGLKAQLIISTTQKELNKTNGTALAYTIHSGPVPLHLFDQTLCDPDITRLTTGEGQNILNAGRTQRLFTAAQRKILLARDLGCTFPNCTTLPTWCEAHHITPWHQGGQTNINNAALLCPRHHTLIHHSDWTMKLQKGTPHFTPPYTLDPTQQPRRNTYHHAHPESRG